MKKKAGFFFILCFLSVSVHSVAQKAEVAISVGGLSTSDRGGSVPCPAFIGAVCPPTTVQSPSRVSYEGTFAGRLANFKMAALYIELPVLGTPARESKLVASSSVLARARFSSVFFTPGVKLKLVPSSPIAPFVSVGAGFAHFGDSTLVGGLTLAGGNTTGAAQVGGGLDLKMPVPFLALRGEVRDYISGTPKAISFLGTKSEPRQHNLFYGAGVVLRF